MMTQGTDRDARHGTKDGMSGIAATRHAPAFFGAIDLGTNNCRLMIATGTQNGFRVVDSFNRSVRLGEGLRTSGRLAEDAMKRALDALRICAERMKQWPIVHVRAVATEACRRAANGREFLARVRHETGLVIDIITPREEAELALESCSPLFRESLPPPSASDRGVLFDIGGGSTEVAWVRIDPERQAQTLIGTTSIPTGVITLQEMFGEGRGSSYEEMVSYVQDHLREFEAVHRIRREVSLGKTRLIGTSGTVTTLAGVALSLPRYSRSAIDGLTLPGQSMIAAIETLRGLNREALVTHPCVGSERVQFVLAGCAIFEAIHRLWPIGNVTIADRGLRDGILLRMARDHGRRVVRGRHDDIRHATPRSRGQFGTYATL